MKVVNKESERERDFMENVIVSQYRQINKNKYSIYKNKVIEFYMYFVI